MQPTMGYIFYQAIFPTGIENTELNSPPPFGVGLSSSVVLFAFQASFSPDSINKTMEFDYPAPRERLGEALFFSRNRNVQEIIFLHFSLSIN
jgi:hypothetical protein